MKVLDYDGLQYYDSLISSMYLKKSGGTLTGALTINQNGNTPLTLKTTASYNDVQVTDGTNRIGVLRFQKDTTNSLNRLVLGVIPYGNNNAPSGIEIYRNSSGTVTATAPTPAAGDNSTKIATTAFVNNYLPLSGGTMTGAITRNGDVVKNSVDTSWTRYCGGTSNANGAHLLVYGKSDSSHAGWFYLTSSNGTNSRSLIGKPDGTLTWNGTAISLNGHTHSYLPLAGGTMTGTITRDGILATSSSNDKNIVITGGTSGASLALDGRNYGAHQGSFTLQANDGSQTKELKGYPNGTLVWAGYNVLTSATTGKTSSQSNTTSKSIAATTATSLTSKSIDAGTWVITGHVRYSSTTAGKNYGVEICTGSSASFNYGHDSAVWCGAGGNAVSLQTTRILTFNSATTVHVSGYAGAACTMESAELTAVRIK